MPLSDDPAPDSQESTQRGGQNATGDELVAPPADPPAAGAPSNTLNRSRATGLDSRRFGGLFSLTALDDINPDHVKNSTAFKLGAVAGLLPALSVVSIAAFLPKDTFDALALDQNSPTSFGAILAVLCSSALVGGSVAFFWAENQLRTIFTYGIAGPTIVLSLFLNAIGGLATEGMAKEAKRAHTEKQEAVDQSEKDIEDLTEQWELLRASFAQTAAVNADDSPHDATGADSRTSNNPDLAAP